MFGENYWIEHKGVRNKMKLSNFLLNETTMTLNQYKRKVKKTGEYLTMRPGNDSSNWDGTWWTAIWSPSGDRDYIKITATRKFDGLSYCRLKATEKAYINRAKIEGIVLNV
jgi:hypothetical protein